MEQAVTRGALCGASPDASGKALFDDVELLSWEELHERVERPRLARQLAYVAEHSPFYREHFGAAGLSPADIARLEGFSALPFSEKRDVLLDQERHPPFGRLATGADRSRLRRVHTTSGTTGRPFCIVLTERDAGDTLEAGRRAFRCAGLAPGDTVVHCLNYCLWAGGVTDHLSLEGTGALVVPFGVGNTRKLVDTIRQVGANVISCTPSYLSTLEVLLRDELSLEPRALGLQKALCGGEGGLQSRAVRQRIEDRWGIRAIDANYGMADVLSMCGAECEARQGLHFHGQGLVLMELIHPETAELLPVREGQAGELVVTNLRREAQPLLRYRTRDIVEITGTGPCPCGRRSLRFIPIGRSDQMVVVRGVNVFPGAVGNLIGEHAAWLSGEFELVLDQPPPIDRLTLRVELASGVSAEESTRVEATLLRLCRQRLSFSPRIDVLPFGALPRTEGKMRRVRRAYGPEATELDPPGRLLKDE